MNGFIIYDNEGAKRNAWFIEHFIKTAKEFGHTLTLKLSDELGEEIPDFAIVRAMDYRINETLEQKGAKVFNNSHLSKIANDKTLCYQFMESSGIPILPTFYEVPENIEFPLVVKSSCGHGGTEVFLVNSDDELKTAISKTEKPVIQKVASDLGKDLRVYVMGNEIIACMLRERNDDFRSNYCLGGKASVYTPNEKELKLINKIISLFDIGFAGIDFVFDNGEIVFNEIEDAVGSRMLYDLTDIDVIKLWFIKNMK